MKELYETPQITVVEMIFNDIITTSSNGKLTDGGLDGVGDSTRW